MDTLVEETQTQLPDEGVRKLPGVKPARSRIRLLKDVVMIVAVVAVLAGLAGFILYRLGLKRDVTSAMQVTDRIISDVAKHDGGDAYKLSSAKFQKQTSRGELIRQFAAIDMVTGGKPTVDGQSIVTRDGEKIAFITYKYPPKLANQPFYIVVGVTEQPDGSWKLTDISGSADKSKLLAQ